MRGWDKYGNWFENLSPVLQLIFIWGSLCLSVWSYIEAGPNGFSIFLVTYSIVHSMIIGMD